MAQTQILGPDGKVYDPKSRVGSELLMDIGSAAGLELGTDITAAGLALLDDANAAAQRSTLGLGNAATLSIGSTGGTVAAGDDSRFGTPTDAELAAIAALTSEADKIIRFTGSGTADLLDLVISTYTPTLTGVANITDSTAHVMFYARLSNVVIVAGKIDLDPTLAATLTKIGIELPVASNFVTNYDCAGIGRSDGSTETMTIYGDGVNKRAEMQSVSMVDVTYQSMFVIFMYRII